MDTYSRIDIKAINKIIDENISIYYIRIDIYLDEWQV
jgi:hypothetical protein